MKVEVYKGKKEILTFKTMRSNTTTLIGKRSKKHFHGMTQGKVNMAHECIDRHVDEGKGEKVALHYKDDQRQESYTFSEMKSKSNKAANVLKDKANVEKGDRVFILCQEHLNFILHYLVF